MTDFITGEHNYLAIQALKSDAAVVWVHGPLGSGKSHTVAMYQRPDDTVIEWEPGMQLPRTSGRLVIISELHPREAGLPDRDLTRVVQGMVVATLPWTRANLARLMPPAMMDACGEDVLDANMGVGVVAAAVRAWNELVVPHPGADWRRAMAAWTGQTVGPWNDSVRLDAIYRAAAAFFRVSVPDLLGPRRTKNLTWPRHVAMYLAKELTQLTWTETGLRCGGRDHSTVVHAVNKMRRLLLDKDAHAVHDVAAVRSLVMV